jgi:HEAT repeat protein
MSGTQKASGKLRISSRPAAHVGKVRRAAPASRRNRRYPLTFFLVAAGIALAIGVLMSWLHYPSKPVELPPAIALSLPEPAPSPAGDDEQTVADSNDLELLPFPAETAAAAKVELPASAPPLVVRQDPGPKPKPPASQPSAVDAMKPPAAPAFKRRDRVGEEGLRDQLALAPEIGIGRSAPQLVRSYTNRTRVSMTVSGEGGLTDASVLRETIPAVATLPLRLGSQAQTNPKAAATLGSLSRKLHAYLDAAAPAGPDGHRSSPALLAQALRREKRGKSPEWLRAEAIPTMLQLLMHEDTAVRRMLVEMLADISGPQATVALAKRAVFDLDPESRVEAVRALKGRPAADSRPIFLTALRYPWPPAADHAAEALAALEDKGAIPALVTLLKEPDPAAPRKLSRGGYVVQELVRAKHIGNCLLCHPPALTGNEPVQGPDPVNTVPARAPGGGGGGGWSGGGGGSGASNRVPLVIRADIVFLRQDFSVQLPAANLPAVQGATPAFRFDFLVRTRRLTKLDTAQLNQPRGETSYPQREAVLFALRELTAQNPGAATADWVRLFPTAQTEVEAGRLAEKLIAAGPVRLAQLLGQAQAGDEDVYIKALATALPRLKGEARETIHEALAQRLARLDTDTLRRRLYDESGVLREAMVTACVRRRDKELIPDLIALLEEGDSKLASQAEKGLETMTGQHLADPTAWREWWESDKRK